MGEECKVFELFPWITSSFVQNLIEKSEQSKHAILKSFTAKKCFNDGENFSSYMIGLKAIFESELHGEKSCDFLLKIAIQTEDYAKICAESLLYEREIEAYTKVLPAVEKLLESVGEFGQIAPRCYTADIERKMIAFEDLRNQQFKGVNSVDGLNMDHMKLALLTLAKWHAGTASLLIENIELFEWYTKRNVYKNSPSIQSFFRNIAQTVSNEIKHWPGYENISEKLGNIPQEAFDNIHKSYEPQDDGFNVITHGDMFMNNLLYRHDQNGKPIDIRFVDFAIGKHVSPSIDLVCLLYGSSDSSIKQDDREHLIQYYHSELVKYLKLLKFSKIPTLFDIQSACFRIDFYNALIILFIVGLRHINKFHDGGFIDVLNNNNNDNSSGLYTNPACIGQLKNLLDIFDRRGYFDF
ncbi:uncharacterized protein LOC116344183 [Contarinia nasturtii]|uniref:uncharacterized protein LOC116344183 n=1 Tax=Contarinia nasturtii TaxID=265458 RepID=UPI0012D383E9|nr:uncharacterized protein LOC116344183 [Contarinia nasturtii]